MLNINLNVCWTQHVGSAGGGCPAWNKVDWDNMSWVSAAVCCSCSHGVDLTVFFHIKCGCSQEDFISCFQMQMIIECFDYVQTWFFSPNLAEKSTITCNLQRFHLTRFAMNAVWWSLTSCIVLRIGGQSNMTLRLRDTFAHDTPAAYHVYI